MAEVKEVSIKEVDKNVNDITKDIEVNSNLLCEVTNVSSRLTRKEKKVIKDNLLRSIAREQACILASIREISQTAPEYGASLKRLKELTELRNLLVQNDHEMNKEVVNGLIAGGSIALCYACEKIAGILITGKGFSRVPRL